MLFAVGFVQKTIRSYQGTFPRLCNNNFVFSLTITKEHNYRYVHYLVGTLQGIHLCPLHSTEREGGLRMRKEEIMSMNELAGGDWSNWQDTGQAVLSDFITKRNPSKGTLTCQIYLSGDHYPSPRLWFGIMKRFEL